MLRDVHKIAFVDTDAGHDPPRLPIMGFPNAELLAQLKQHAE